MHIIPNFTDRVYRIRRCENEFGLNNYAPRMKEDEEEDEKEDENVDEEKEEEED